MMLNVNLFGGPGTGKSTTAAALFAIMKKQGYKVELLQEYAKDLTYSNESTRLSDQLHVMGEQHHRLHRLVDKVNYVVHDSPFIMGTVYLQDNCKLPVGSFKDMAFELFSSYNNLNIFLQRDNKVHAYQEYGRNQTLLDAEYLDECIKGMLLDNNIPFITLQISANTESDILNIIKEHNGRTATIQSATETLNMG